MNPDQLQQPIISEEEIANLPVDKRTALVNFIKNKKVLIFVSVALLIIGVIVYFFAASSKPKTYNLTSKDLEKTLTINKTDTVVFETKANQGLELSTQLSDPSVADVVKTYDPKTGQFSEKIIPKAKGETDVIVTGHLSCPKGVICLPLEQLISKNHIVVK
jgi:hypothetical protein